MGNANDSGGFHESDDEHEDHKQDGHNNNVEYLPDPTDDDNENDPIIYQSQYAMNLYGVTDSGEFVTNAIKRVPKENHVHRIKDIFKYKKKLGEGASGKVLLAQQKFGEQNKCALKELQRKHKVNAQLFLREVVILEALRHPNILELYGVYLDKSSYFIATAYYSGGEFFDKIIKIKKFSEKQALKYIKPILEAIKFMHDCAIVHRDIKPSNMVFDKKGKHGKIKIIDFGTSEIVIDEDIYAAERVGTILYAPPEWKRDRIGSHIKKGDLWSLGVIVYVLMVGRLPFGEWKHIEGYNNDLWFPKKLKKKLSYQCIDFILKSLERYPEQRLSAEQGLKHPWVAKDAVGAKDEDLGADLKHGLKSVHAETTVAKLIAKVNHGQLSITDLDKEQRAIVYDNVKNQKDVEKFLDMYKKQLSPHPEQQAIVNANAYANVAKGGGYNPHSRYHAPPPKQVPFLRHQKAMFGSSKDIMESIHMFREHDVVYRQQKEKEKIGRDRADGNGNGMMLFNEDMDDDEYEETVKKTLSVIGTELNDEQKEAELRDMLGDDIYIELKDDIDKQHKEDIQQQKLLQERINGHRKNITHKNIGNPLNIQREEDEDFHFDENIVEKVLELGLATRQACIRAVLATESKGVNQAAEWLLNHQNDHGINQRIDVL